MKWLVARYPKPQGELIFLGSILTDPEEPETSLNRKTGAVKIPEEDKIDDSAAVRQEIHSELSTNASALLKVVPPNSPLFSAGLKAEGNSSHEVKTTVEAMNVKAEIFIPDKSYVDKALVRPEITAYVKDGAWAKSLYMIVGVATAGTLAVTKEQSRDMNAALSANVSVAGTGTELAGELSGRTKARGGSKLKTENATDFAYKVREFEYLKFRLSGRLKDKGDRSKGAMFGRGGRDDRDSNDEGIVPVFEDWAEEDIEAFGMFTLRT
jgi:hypothetical protein